MPTLNWIGKEAVVKHHKEVPFRLLEPAPELSCGDADSGSPEIRKWLGEVVGKEGETLDEAPRTRHCPECGTSASAGTGRRVIGSAQRWSIHALYDPKRRARQAIGQAAPYRQ
ncbi:MAG: hypothetical protein ACNA7M_15445, partial [Roseovarius sp.]